MNPWIGWALAVVAVALDREGIKKAAPFYRQTGVANLTLYTDRRGSLFEELDGRNLPTTFILDRAGRVVVRSTGYDALRVTVRVKATPKKGSRDTWRANSWRKSWRVTG